MAAEGIPVEVACRVVEVSVSGYYDWLSRPPSARSIRHAWLTDLHQASRGVYGSRRVHAELRLGRGIVVGHGAGELLMPLTYRTVAGAVSARWSSPGSASGTTSNRSASATRRAATSNAGIVDACSSAQPSLSDTSK